LWRGFVHITRTTPCRFISLQFSQMRLTDALTFISLSLQVMQARLLLAEIQHQIETRAIRICGPCRGGATRCLQAIAWRRLVFERVARPFFSQGRQRHVPCGTFAFGGRPAPTPECAIVFTKARTKIQIRCWARAVPCPYGSRRFMHGQGRCLAPTVKDDSWTGKGDALPLRLKTIRGRAKANALPLRFTCRR